MAFKQTTANTVKTNIFELQQILKMSSTSLRVFYQSLSKAWDNFVLKKCFPCFLHCDF